MKKVIKGKVTEIFNKMVTFMNHPVPEGLKVGKDYMEEILEDFIGKNVKITIEEIKKARTK